MLFLSFLASFFSRVGNGQQSLDLSLSGIQVNLMTANKMPAEHSAGVIISDIRTLIALLDGLFRLGFRV